MDPAYVAAHIEEAPHHWWFRGRLAVILGAVQRLAPPRRPLRLLELGCGSGTVLAALAAFGEAVGMECDPVLRDAARGARLDVRAGTLPADLVVDPGWADVVLLLDVLEHLDDEAGALATAGRALAPGGLLVTTVPAYPWLWSGHDERLGHRRRYTAAALRRVLERAGFGVLHLTYFNTLLFPMVVLARGWTRIAGHTGHDLHPVPWLANELLARVFALERGLVPRMRLPFGSSLLACARP
jgi:SAM-dependent methyltransferase